MQGSELVKLIVEEKLWDTEIKVMGMDTTGNLIPDVSFVVEEFTRITDEDTEEEFGAIIINAAIEN